LSKQQQRVTRTALDNLVSNLRGEVGDIVGTWVLLRQLMRESSRLSSSDPAKDFTDPALGFLGALEDKLEDEIVARLSELGERKIGRLTFHFAAVKLNAFGAEARAFSKYVEAAGFKAKRNHEISHRALPEQWSEHRSIFIPYRTLLRGIVRAVRLMKAIDVHVLGPKMVRQWRHVRRLRYDHTLPPRVAYLMLSHYRVPVHDGDSPPIHPRRRHLGDTGA
jgi:hypothetical protein